MKSEPEALFDLAAEMDHILKAQDLARRMGKHQMGVMVHGWLTRHLHCLSVEAVRELSEITRDEA